MQASSSSSSSSSDTDGGAESSSDPVEELSEERKANLFQFLLRDLQVQGVPLLGVDADQVHTLQAALWTTMAELSEQDDEEKACLIFESIPVPALRSFVDDFMILKTQQRLMKFVPELERFSLSLVGKGVGPAVLIEVTKKDTTTTATPTVVVDEHRNSAAMKMFVDRMVAGRQISGYPSSSSSSSSKDADDASANNQQVPPMMYRTCNIAETCHILSSFWNNICELLASPPGNSIMLSLPTIDNPGRFGAVSELLSRSLCLYRGDDIFELLHFYPDYDRNQIHPVDKPAHGHLPPLSWLLSMLRHSGSDEQADKLSDQDVALLNYQRRAPVASVCIVPVDLLEANLSPADAIVNLDIGDGIIVQASGVETYSNSLIELCRQGEAQLKASLETEREMASGEGNLL